MKNKLFALFLGVIVAFAMSFAFAVNVEAKPCPINSPCAQGMKQKTDNCEHCQQCKDCKNCKDCKQCCKKSKNCAKSNTAKKHNCDCCNKKPTQKE